MSVHSKILIGLCVAVGLKAQILGNTNGQGPFAPGGAYSYNQFLGPFFQQPFFTFSPNSLTIVWTQGTIYVGNGAVNISAGSVALTGSKTTCAASAVVAGTDSCNYIYSNATGTIAATTAIATAAAAGNSILALAVTSSTGVTSLEAPYQSTLGTMGVTSSAKFYLTVNNTPGATSAAIQTAGQTFTYTGLASGDDVTLVNWPAPTSLCPPVGVRATALNTLTIYFLVLTASACTPAAGNYTIEVTR